MKNFIILLLLFILLILLSINISIYYTINDIKIGGTRSESAYEIISVEQDSELYKIKYDKKNDAKLFYKVINCPHFKELEDMLLQKCITTPSIYDQCKKIKKNGLQLCILEKGKLLYKAFNGFVTERMEKSYLEKNPNGVSWYGNIYTSYEFAKQAFGGLNIYIVEKDIILFDYFNYNNLKILINYLYKIKCDRSIITEIKLYTGFYLNKEEQYKQLMLKKQYKKKLYIFNNPILDHYNYKNCLINNDKRLNPYTYLYDVETLQYLFHNFFKKYNIDGVIRKQHKGTLNVYGLTTEGIILPSYTILHKLKIYDNHPLYWKNWNIDPNIYIIPKDGIATTLLFGAKNQMFKILKFYQKYALNKLPTDIIYSDTNSISLLSYNIHEFGNINADINDHTNTLHILHFLIKLNADIIFLQETNCKNINNFIHICNKHGYSFFKVFNGYYGKGSIKSQLCILYKNVSNIYKIDISTIISKREMIVIKLKNITIIGVHLEIGYAYINIKDEAIKNETILKNYNLRIGQLKEILKLNPDIIIGDFNFNPDDAEYKFMEGYNYINIIHEVTTPFNTTVDMIFIKKNIKSLYSKVLEYNYSDHLPIYSVLEI